jgi:hypothetical protein
MVEPLSAQIRQVRSAYSGTKFGTKDVGRPSNEGRNTDHGYAEAAVGAGRDVAASEDGFAI